MQQILVWFQKRLLVIYEFFFPLPKVCPICLKRQPRMQVCEDCRVQALKKRSNEGQCQKCSCFGVFRKTCRNCRTWPKYFAGNISIWPYKGNWQQAILDFKFRNRPWLAETFASELAPFLPKEYDVLIPVPLHPNREKERGYNQSWLLAKALSEQSGIVCEQGLIRCRDTIHQTGLPREQRLENLENAFVIHPKYSVQGKKILLVDDVFTTGATLRECAKTLYQHGAIQVQGVTLASGEGSF